VPITERVKLYQDIEQHRSRPMIVYVTNQRLNSQGLMASDAIPELLDQLSSIGPQEKKVDFLIVSMGGDPTVAWRIMSLLRERFTHVSVLVPQAAFSAATLLALGADEIVMHPHGNLGPVDPQFNTPKPGGGEVRFGYEELSAFFEFAKAQGIKDQEQVRALFSDLAREVGAIALGAASRGSRLLLSMGEQLLRMHMGESEAKKAKEIAEKLNRSFAHHGYPLSRQEAKAIGLKISPEDLGLEDLMWRAWLDIESDLQARRPFNVVNELEQSPAGATLFAPIQQVQLPGNLPPQIAQQAYAQILQQVGLTPVNPVDFETIQAVIESTRRASRHRTSGRVLASRLPDGQLQMNVITLMQGWQSVQIPAAAQAPAIAAPSPAAQN
jgi:hypothetical protein